MRNHRSSPRCRAALAALALAGVAPVTHAAQVAFWRMEADTDAVTAGAQVANEVPGGSILTGPGTISTPTPGPIAPNPILPFILPNNGALDGNADVNMTAASYEALNTGSITVEGFFRTQEGTATLIARSNATAAGGTKGFVISQPNDVQVSYFVNNVLQTVKGGTGGIPLGAVNLDSPYTHLAFTYDAATGVANLYADGILRGTNTTVGGGALFAPGDAINLNLGGGTFVAPIPNTGGYDGGGLSSTSTAALIDEIRISDTALLPIQFIAVPEPGGLALLGVGAVAMLRRRHRA